MRNVGCPTPTGTLCPSLPHVPIPGSSRHVVADHRHLRQCIGAVADQRCALDRARDLAVFDHVGLGHAEHELAVGDVDLTAAEIGCVNAFADRAHDFIRIFVAGEHVGVGHARHRQMRKRLTAAVPGRCNVHQPRVQRILDVAAQNSVFDHHGALCRVAFIVDAQRSAAVRNRAVVDDGDTLRRDALPDLAGKCARTLCD